MIESDNFGGFTISCDICEESDDFDTDGNWQAMITEAKHRGWKIKKEGDEWKHYCPECAKEL